MSILNVNSIASLESLKGAMGGYSGQSLALVQGFASILSSKIERLEQMERYFADRVRQTEAALRYCRIAQASDPMRSCAWEASEAARAEANYRRYQTIMTRVRQAQSEYQAAGSNYERSLEQISSSTIPKMTAIINDMKAYTTLPSEQAVMPTGTYIGNSGGQNITPANPSPVTSTNGQDTNSPATPLTADPTNNNSKNTSGLPGQNESRSFGSTATIGVATGIGGGVAVGIAAAFITNYLQHNEGDLDALVDRAFREQYGIGTTEILLMQSPKREEYIEKYNALCDEVETEANRQYNEKMTEYQTQPEKQEYDNAMLADHVYNSEKTLGINWSIVSPNNINENDQQLVSDLVKKIEELNNDGSGFYAQLYKNDVTGEYTLAFKGSDMPLVKWSDANPISLAHSVVKGDYNLDDWVWTNAAQGLGFPSKQYDNAKELGKIINGNDNFKIVGHSLGGGLATVAGLESGCATYTYNQAAVTHGTVKRLDLNTSNTSNIIRYADPSEPLTLAQNAVNYGQDVIERETTARAWNKSEFNYAQDQFKASAKDMNTIRKPEDKYFMELGEFRSIDTNGSHSMKDVVSHFENKNYQTLNSRLNHSNYKFEKGFKTNRISESLPESENIKNLRNAFKDAGIVGIVSKNKRR